MAVWLRRGAIALAGVLVVFAALAAWFVATFDANKYKGVAIEWMKTHRNRTLAIEGPIELSVFPRLAVKASQVSLSEAGRPDVFAAVQQAGLAVDVLPLLRGELVIGRVEARGVRLAYQRDAKGRSNIDDLLQPDPAADPKEKKPLRFDVSGIVLEDVRATVKDQAGGTEGELVVKALKAGRIANKVEAPVELDLAVAMKQPAVKGTLGGKTRLLLDTDTASASLRDMSLRFQGDAPGAAGIDTTLKGSLAWDGAKKSVDAQALSVQLSGHTGAVKHDGSAIDVKRFAYDPARKSLALQELKARIKGTQGGHPLSLDLDWPELAVDGNALKGSAFNGKLSQGGELPLVVEFQSRPPTGTFDHVQLPGFEAKVQSHAARRKVDGKLRADLGLRPAQASLALDKLDLQAQVQEAQSPPLALAVRGSALASAQRSSWNLAGQLNENRFTIEGSAVTVGTVPAITARANFDSLDFNKLLGAPAAAQPAAQPTAADTPVDLAALRSVNGQFNLRAARLAFRQYRVADAKLDATLDGGMLRITDLQGKAWGGQLVAIAFADARASRVSIKGAATGVNVNALVKDVAAKDLIEGTGRVQWDLDTAGRSIQEMRSRLKGSASLMLRDGALKGVNLAKSLRQAKAALTMKQDSVQKAAQTEKTDFSELSASFQVADGVARSRDLDMKSPFLRLGGEGAIDVGRNRIDYVARATVASTSKGQDGAELAALKGLTIPVRLTGPLEAIDWKIEWSAVAGAAVQQRLEDKLSEKLGLKPPAPAGPAASQPRSKSDELKKTLKGLFK